MSELKAKLKGLEGRQPSKWQEQALYRRKNREWLKKSNAIAVKVLEALRNQRLKQKDLAVRLNITPQQVSKILQGQENLTLQTITQLEMALGIKLIYVTELTQSSLVEYPMSGFNRQVHKSGYTRKLEFFFKEADVIEEPFLELPEV